MKTFLTFFALALFMTSTTLIGQEVQIQKLAGISTNSKEYLKVVANPLAKYATIEDEEGSLWMTGKGDGVKFKHVDDQVKHISVYARLNASSKKAGWSKFTGTLPFQLTQDEYKEKALISMLDEQSGITNVKKVPQAIEFETRITNVANKSIALHVYMPLSIISQKGDKVAITRIEMEVLD